MSPTRRDFIKATTRRRPRSRSGLAVSQRVARRRRRRCPRRRPMRRSSSSPTKRSTPRVVRARRTPTCASAATVVRASRRASVRSPASATASRTASACARWSTARWGFAATSVMTRAGAQAAALEAIVMSRAARAVQARPVELAPVKPVTGTWITPVTRDPLEVPIEDKIALLLATNEAALKVANVRFVNTQSRAAPRSEDARDVGRHQRHADDDPRRAVVLGDGDRRRRLPELRRGARAARLGLGVRRVAEHARQRRAMGVAGRREADGEERRRPVSTI